MVFYDKTKNKQSSIDAFFKPDTSNPESKPDEDHVDNECRRTDSQQESHPIISESELKENVVHGALPGWMTSAGSPLPYTNVIGDSILVYIQEEVKNANVEKRRVTIGGYCASSLSKGQENLQIDSDIEENIKSKIKTPIIGSNRNSRRRLSIPDLPD